MAPTTAVWRSKISLKRQGFSSAHCTKLSLTPTRMTPTPTGADSHPDLSGIEGQLRLSTAFCEASSAVSTCCSGFQVGEAGDIPTRGGEPPDDAAGDGIGHAWASQQLASRRCSKVWFDRMRTLQPFGRSCLRSEVTIGDRQHVDTRHVGRIT